MVTDHAAPARDVPLYVASRGEQIDRLASREADGVFLSDFAPDRLDEVLGWVRSDGSPRVALYQSVRFRTSSDDDPTAMSGDPRHIASVLDELVDAVHARLDRSGPRRRRRARDMVPDAVDVFDLLDDR